MIRMSTYGIVENNFIVNMVLWNGKGDIFADVNIIDTKGFPEAKIGDAVLEGVVYYQPSSQFEHEFNIEKKVWELTESGETAKNAWLVSENKSQRDILVRNAKETISLWQTELSLGSISDENKATLQSWIDYINALNALEVDSTDVTWPTSP